jgi:N utilization substance protein B
MQALYQIDMRGDADLPAIHVAVREDAPDPADGEEAYALAAAAWHSRGEADAKVVQLAPEWPTHRQPPVDRAILRLAWHEMATGRTPVKVAINEAVELAKAFCAEHSPSFINGVLDKMARDVKVVAVAEEPAKPASPEAWLADALDENH